MANMLAAASFLPVCYNHLEKCADFKCFDCKYESVIHLCPQCNIQVHSLDVFRAHRVEKLEVKGRERRLSQDVSDIEKLIEVEQDLLQSVLTKLRYTEQEEKDSLSQLIHLQNATKKRMAEIKDCEATIEKAFSYLAKVSTMITQCSSPVEGSNDEAVKDPPAESTVEQPTASVPGSSDEPCERPLLEPLGEDQKVLPKEPLLTLNLPDEIKDKEVFPVCVIGSLTRTGTFWITKIGEADQEKQRQIQATIRNHYFKIGGFGSPVVPKEGVFCAAYHRQSKERCRARIEHVTNSGTIRIRFLDLGVVEELSQSSLSELPMDVVDASFQALECCLLPDPDTQLKYEAKWCFKDLTFNKVLMAAVEGQVTDKKGNVLHHVMLGSCEEIPVCINSQVAKLVEAQKQALEDRPLQPKVEKSETVEVASGDNACKSQALETTTPGNLVQETDTTPGNHVQEKDTTPGNHVQEKDTKNSAPEEDEVLAKRETENSVCDKVSIIDDSSAKETDYPNEDKPVLRAEAAEFVPVSPESDSLPEKIPLHTALEQSSVPGILHVPVQDAPVCAVPATAFERFINAVPDTQLPVGCVDFATYYRILTKCSLNMIYMEDLANARFLMIRSDVRRIVEAMKFNLWCSSVYGNGKLNRVFHEAANKERSPVYLLFSGIKSSVFCGMAEMVSAVDPKQSCPMLNDPFRFGSKMIGRCDIKWIYANNLHFGDVTTPNSGYSKRYLDKATDGYEIVNKLGQIIVKAFDSSGNFQSVLQQAMKSHQSYLTDQQEYGESFDVEPSWSTPEPSEGLPSSPEDWDQEIEDSLKASKWSESDKVDVSSVQDAPKDIPYDKEEADFSVVPEVKVHVTMEETSRDTPSEKKETDFSAESDVVTHRSMKETSLPAADSSSVISDVQIQTDNSKDFVLSDGDTASDVEECITKAVDAHHQDASTVVPEQQQGYNHQEKVQDGDQGIFHVGSTESQGTVEASASNSQEKEAEESALEERQTCVASSQEMEPEGSAPNEIQEDVDDEQSINAAGESDWETSLTDCVFVSDVAQFNSAVSECAKDDSSSTDVQKTVSSKGNSPCGSTVDVKKESSDVTQVSVVLGDKHDFHDSSDEAVHVASKAQQELSETINNTQDNGKLESHTCNSSGVEAVEDNPVGGRGEAFPHPCTGDKVCDGSEIVVTDTGGSSTLEDKRHVNGETGAKQHVPVSVDLCSEEVLSHESSELSDEDDLPVEIGKEHWIEPQESVSSSGTFWARVVRTSKEETCFVNSMERMGAHIAAKQKTLDPGGIHIYKQCAVKGWDGLWYRALVEKILDKGKIDIRLLDLGEIWQVHQKELRVLDDEFYASPPAQAFECTLCYENPNSKKEKSRTSKLVKRNKKIRVLVKNHSGDGTVGVQVLS